MIFLSGFVDTLRRSRRKSPVEFHPIDSSTLFEWIFSGASVSPDVIWWPIILKIQKKKNATRTEILSDNYNQLLLLRFEMMFWLEESRCRQAPDYFSSMTRNNLRDQRLSGGKNWRTAEIWGQKTEVKSPPPPPHPCFLSSLCLVPLLHNTTHASFFLLNISSALHLSYFSSSPIIWNRACSSRSSRCL